ncbi:MAG: glutamate synthase-related protein [Chitinophagales bacterium]
MLWELGLSEAYQTLVKNNLRSRVVLQTDGMLRNRKRYCRCYFIGCRRMGITAAHSRSTMMRKCHLNTCPVGIATQDPILRARFTGDPQHIINFNFIVQDLREIMSQLGFRTVK